MYNGNGGGRYNSVGGFRIKPMYLYVAGVVAVLVAIYFVMRFFSAGLQLHFGAFAGLLLLIANLRELIGASSAQRGSTALLNVMVAGGLIFAWLATIVNALLWLPALILVGIATPLIFSQASVYRGYIGVARNAADTVRRTLVR